MGERGSWGAARRERAPSSSNPLPKAWAIKYFMAASASWFTWEEVKRGIKDIKFNSKPIQIKIQWLPLKASTEPRIKVQENKQT